MAQPEKASLYFRNGSSDKIYTCELVQDGDGWHVNFAFGRRGATLTPGTKTATPVSFEKARAIYKKLLAEKIGKGYTPGEDGTPYVGGPEEERTTGLTPQLLNPIEEHEVGRYLDDPAWGAQEKYDGKHMLLRGQDGKLEAINRKGLICGFPKTVEAEGVEFMRRFGNFLLDGEAVGDALIVFDLLEVGGEDNRDRSYLARHMILSRFATDILLVAPLMETVATKHALYDELRAHNAEGIVFKRLYAPYRPGRPNSGGDQLKFKFVATATCLVMRVNDKRSVALAVMGDDGLPVAVGNCTIPANHEIPQAGSRCEVRYLYFFNGGALYQPVYLGPRDDVEVDKLATLKRKAE